MKKFLLGIVIGILFTGLAGVIAVFALARAGDRRPTVADGSTLIYKLEGEVPEAAPEPIPLPFFGTRRAVTVLDHISMLRKAAADKRVRAVLFVPDDLSVGWAKLEELRAALVAFRASGKPLYAWLHTPGTPEYYLASACERIYLAEDDRLDMKGLRAELSYYRRTLDKVGAQIEIEHAGRFKDYGDQFTRTDPTPETRAVINNVLDTLYGHLTGVLAGARKKSPEQMRALLDQGPFLAHQAKSSGLVDQIAFEDQVHGDLKSRLKQKELVKLSHWDYVRVPAAGLGTEGGKRIGVLVGQGGITRGGSSSAVEDYDGIASEDFIRLTRQVANDSSLAGVIVRIDSPGGDAIASGEILRELKLLSRKKPTVISMSDAAASGGYYMAMTGDPVVAYPNTFTGSIGVVYGKPNLGGLYEKLGIDQTILTRGRYAGIDSLSRGFTPEERAKLREGIDDTYQTFLRRVSEGRRQPVAQLEPLAQGRVWLGSEAKNNGLVDQLGGYDAAVQLLKARAKIGKDEKVRLVVFPRRKPWLEQWFAQSSDDNDVETRVWQMLRQQAGLQDLRPLLKGGMMAMQPWSLRVR